MTGGLSKTDSNNIGMLMPHVFTLVKKIALDKPKGNLLKSSNDFRSKNLPTTEQRQRPASAAIGFATTSLALIPWPMRPSSILLFSRGRPKQNTDSQYLDPIRTQSSSNDASSLQHDLSDAIMHFKSPTFCAATVRRCLRPEPPPLAL
jgi:hypothetical protein